MRKKKQTKIQAKTFNLGEKSNLMYISPTDNRLSTVHYSDYRKSVFQPSKAADL